jgi:hypothetical protein
MSQWTAPKTVNLVDLGFMDARSKLIDLAAFLDRVERAGQQDDFRVQALREAIACLQLPQAQRAKAVLDSFSDPSSEPLPVATVKGACGANPPPHLRA